MANITTQTIRVDLNTGKVIPTAYVHQNDTARTLVFSMYLNGMPYTMTGHTVKFAYQSPIVNGQYTVITGSSMATGTVSGSTVSVSLPVAYTQISGVGMLTMIITPSSGTIRPVNIRFVVQKSADGDDTIAGSSDFPDYVGEKALDVAEDVIDERLGSLEDDFDQYLEDSGFEKTTITEDVDIPISWSSASGYWSKNGNWEELANSVASASVSVIPNEVYSLTSANYYEVPRAVFFNGNTFLSSLTPVSNTDLVTGTEIVIPSNCNRMLLQSRATQTSSAILTKVSATQTLISLNASHVVYENQTLDDVLYDLINNDPDTTTITTTETVIPSWSTITDSWIDKRMDAVSVGQSDGFKYFDMDVNGGDIITLTSKNYYDMARAVLYSGSTITSVVFTASDTSLVSNTEITIPSGVTKIRFQSWYTDVGDVSITATITKTVSINGADSIVYDGTTTVKDALDEIYEDLETVATINRLTGKKIVYNGDSICEERLTGSSANGGAYAKLIADAVGGTYENTAVGGATFATGTGARHIISSTVSNMSSAADIVCFEGGINDFFNNVPIGSTSDSYTDTVDTTTLMGSIESIIRQSIAKWATTPIVWVIVHKFDTAWTTPNSNGDTYKDYHDAIIEVLNKYAIPYYDCALCSGFSVGVTSQRSTFMHDGEHPNETGYRHMYVPQLIKLFESVLPY